MNIDAVNNIVGNIQSLSQFLKILAYSLIGSSILGWTAEVLLAKYGYRKAKFLAVIFATLAMVAGAVCLTIAFAPTATLVRIDFFQLCIVTSGVAGLTGIVSFLCLSQWDEDGAMNFGSTLNFLVIESITAFGYAVTLMAAITYFGF